MNWFLDVVKNKYATFSGRARRKEYWMYVLFYFLIAIGIGIVETVLGLGGGRRDGGTFYWSGPLTGLYSLALLLPSLAVTVRRLHDTGRTGWWMLIGLIPFLGWLVLLYFMAIEGEPGPNQYGPNPKAVGGAMPTGTVAGGPTTPPAGSASTMNPMNRAP